MKSDLSVQNLGSLLSLPANTTQNGLHDFYHQLLGNCDYPFLAKILFLQLVTRENVLLYSSRRAEVKEAWMGLAKQLKDNQASVFAIDPQSKIDEMLSSKGQRRVLLFDLGKIGTQGVNFLLNNPLAGITILAVEDQTRPLRSQLSDIFPLVFRDEDSLQDEHSTVAPSSAIFDRQRFQASIAANFNLSVENKEQDGFFKSYVYLLKERAHQYGVQLPLSRWKKMGLILKLIGTSRTPGFFKHLGPTDCLMAPQCLGRTPQQLQNLSKANQQTLIDLIPNYGTQHWIKQLTHHFWISSIRKNYYISLAEKLSNRVSFFYPCMKYPDVVKLLVDQKSFHYRVIGHDKKLLSDKYFEVNSQKGYRLCLQFRCPDSILLHIGIACYDKEKKLISPVQVCRVEDSAVRIKAVQDKQIIVVEEDAGNLAHWKPSKSFAYEKCIGFYAKGDTDVLLSQQEVLMPEADHYSQDQNKAIYSATTQNSIILTDNGYKQFKKCSEHLLAGQSKIMNHYQGGTYCLGGSFKVAEPAWKQVKMNFKGMSRQNNGSSFLFGSRWIRVVMLVNYNSGYPDFVVQKKQASVDFRSVEWHGI